jgi:hypothetical protein
MKHALLLITLVVLPAWGQHTANMSSTGSATSQITYVSSFSDCGAVNCFHASVSNPFEASMIFSSNHKTFAIDSTGTGWELTDYPTNSWVKHLE